jgi:hypothetical protein
VLGHRHRRRFDSSECRFPLTSAPTTAQPPRTTTPTPASDEMCRGCGVCQRRDASTEPSQGRLGSEALGSGVRH